MPCCPLSQNNLLTILTQTLPPHFDPKYTRFEIATKRNPSRIYTFRDNPNLDRWSAAVIGYDKDGKQETVVSAGQERGSEEYSNADTALRVLHKLAKQKANIKMKEYGWEILATVARESREKV
jgi:hypothetical protein